MVAVVAAAVVTLSGGSHSTAAATTSAAPAPPATPTPTSAAQQYLQAFAVGAVDTAGTLTDDQQASFAALQDAWHTLRPSTIRTELGSVTPTAEHTASATYTATWTLDDDHVWSYPGALSLVQTGRNWRVHWTPAVLQPTLRTGQRLALVTTVPDHPAVVDNAGTPLVLTGTDSTHLVDTTHFGMLRSVLISEAPPAPKAFAVDRVDATGHAMATLFGTTGTPEKPARTTLSVSVQTAAQHAVDGYSGAAVIVALRPSDGGLLAVARNTHSTDSPFTGLEAPGSTFKIVTATAAMENGIATENSALPCPLTERIGTRTISNEGFDLGTTTMHRAFARSSPA